MGVISKSGRCPSQHWDFIGIDENIQCWLRLSNNIVLLRFFNPVERSGLYFMNEME